jgi:hypothetical protein
VDALLGTTIASSAIHRTRSATLTDISASAGSVASSGAVMSFRLGHVK